MTTLNAEPVAFEAANVEGAGPVRLCPWLENPYRLVSLWDIVIEFSAESVFWSGLALEVLKTDCFMHSGLGEFPISPTYQNSRVDAETSTKTITWLDAVQNTCVRLGMLVSSETINEIVEALKKPDKRFTYQWLNDQIGNLQRLVKKEIKTKAFFYITPEKIRFWPRAGAENLFGDTVAVSFPSASFDIAESGICLATSRATACVFHLMRVLEIGLTAFGALFSISLAHTNWAPAIEQIESKVRDMHKDSAWKAMPDCKEQQEFYAQAASHFGILKDAWRNYTAHARGIYTEEKAELIFDNVREFMQALATRLHE